MLLSIPRYHVSRTVQFDNSIPYTEINGYKFHTEVFGLPEFSAVIVVHGGPGQGYQYMNALRELSGQYRVIFYDQRGAGLSPRVDKQQLTLEQNLEDLNSIIHHFSGEKKVKLIGHSWGGLLVAAYLSRNGDKVNQAVLIEPLFLCPGAAVEEWVRNFKKWTSFWKIAPHLVRYFFVRKEDGQEGYDYLATRIAQTSKGPPYNCKGEVLPPGTFQRLGYEAYKSILQPVIKNPESFKIDLSDGISKYQGDLMLISSECSFMGSAYQEKYNLPKLPAQTVHVKAKSMGHNLLTLNPQWSLQVMEKFFKQ